MFQPKKPWMMWSLLVAWAFSCQGIGAERLPRVFIPANETVTINKDSFVYGSRGKETLVLSANLRVQVDSNVETIVIPSPLSEFLFSMEGNHLIVRSRLSDHYEIGVTGFSRPVTFRFSDVEQVVTLEGLNAGRVGEKPINEQPTPYEPVTPFERDFDVVYVRYPAPPGEFVKIPQGSSPYVIAPGADLMLLKVDGTEEVLVDCEDCSVMDPFISYDGTTVYYSLIEDARCNKLGCRDAIASASWIYKINLTQGPPYTPIRLTYNDGFESRQYAGNTTEKHDQSYFREIRDMGPVPLADGRVLFTSNRAGLIPFHDGTQGAIRGVQQLYVIDDHNGEFTTGAEMNLHRLETGNIHMVQHPIQLKDGRILFSSWQDAGTRFHYAMTSLFTVHPDGSNLQQFTEPHDHHKNLEHFVTQLPDEQVVAGWYYPSFDYGYGALLRYPISSPGPDFVRRPLKISDQHGQSFRELDRKGTMNLTPHTDPADRPAPNLSGKYAMPSVATREGDMLVAYSSGSTNYFGAVCEPDNCAELKSGIYLIRQATINLVESPEELVLIKDDPNYNEIWPRAVVPYSKIFGQETPDKMYTTETSGAPMDSRLAQGEAAGIVGTSSMYNRDKADPEEFRPQSRRETHDGNWRIQGAEAGVVENSDIFGVRIVATPPKPYTKTINRYTSDPEDKALWTQVKDFLSDSRSEWVVDRYASLHNERWEILGEFPLTHKNITDLQGNPDTSWAAKIPAETPFLIQTLDKNGMTLISELTWRALKPGEKRVDCGGCHAHALEPLDFETTQAGKQAPLTGIGGVKEDDPRVQQGLWNLTTGSIPLLSSDGVEFHEGRALTVEFGRDVLPILQSRCQSCHSGGKGGARPDFSGEPFDVFARLADKNDPTGIPYASYTYPQVGRYLRVPQARQSLLVWVAWGERLDGRTNTMRPDDIDYPEDHPAVQLTDKEKRTIARWVDMGSPVNFPRTDGFGYTDDNQLPVIHVYRPARGNSPNTTHIVIGLTDARSGVDWQSLEVSYKPLGSRVETPVPLTQAQLAEAEQSGVLHVPMPTGIKASQDYVLSVQVRDKAGNLGIDRRRFRL